MSLADQFFRNALGEAKGARAYLEEREIKSETILQFGLGYAPLGSQLRAELQAQGFTLEEITACGLIKRGEGGDSYDKFRNRITFPIQDSRGRTIAFGGRSLGDAQPKYLNSPETPLYAKSNSLYGLNLTQSDIRRKDFAILVEGYFDCVVPYQCGVRNVVASLGTSLTQGQVRLLGRYTRNVVVNFDPDSAGMAAATRSIDLFLEQGFHVNVLQLPSGEDPDSFILRMGAEKYNELLVNSAPYLDFLLSHFQSAQREPFSPKGKQQIVAGIIPYLLKVPNRIERSEYVSRVAARLRVNEELLILEMRKFSRAGPRRDDSIGPLVETGVTISESTILAAVFEESFQERILLQILPELFEGLRTEGVFRAIFEFKNQNREISVLTLREVLGAEDLDLLERIVLESSGEELTEEAIEACLGALRDMQVNRVSQEIQEAIIREERSGEVSDQLDTLLRKKEALRRKQRT
jgi:DNA primase